MKKLNTVPYLKVLNSTVQILNNLASEPINQLYPRTVKLLTS